MALASPSHISSIPAALFLTALFCGAFCIGIVAAEDSTPPDVSITSGTKADSSYTLRAEVTDSGSGVAVVRYFLNSELSGELSDDGGDSYSVRMDTTELQEGSHTITVKAKDNAGNWNNNSAISLEVEHSSPPSLWIDSFATDRPFTEGVQMGSTIVFTFTVRNAGSTAVEADDFTYIVTVDEAEGNKKPTTEISDVIIFPDDVPGHGSVVVTYEWKADQPVGSKLVGLKMAWNEGQSERSQFTHNGILIHEAEETQDSPAPPVVAFVGAIAFAVMAYRRPGRRTE